MNRSKLSKWTTWIIGSIVLIGTQASADQIRLMTTGATGLAQVQQMLHSANRTIDIMTYIWDPCSMVSKMMLQELVAKVKQGVRVRVIVDAYTHDDETQKNFTASMEQAGIELRYFNNAFAYSPTINFRMHAKLMVIDSEKYYTGGRNLADDYFDMETANWIDRDVAVKGPSAHQAQRNFNSLWTSNLVKPLYQSLSVQESKHRKDWNECFNRNADDEKLSRELSLNGAKYLALEETYSCDSVTPVVDDPNFMKDDNEGRGERDTGVLSDEHYLKKHTTKTIVDLIASAKSHIWIENYSYIPRGRLADALAKQRQAKVPIDVYTSDVMDTGEIDEIASYYHEHDAKRSEHIYGISSAGSFSQAWPMTPHDEKPYWMIHTKVALTADVGDTPKNAFVGSFNIDPRSYHTNLESGVLVKACPAFANRLQASILRLRDAYQKDLTCKECHKPRPKADLSEKVKAWLEVDFL